MSDDGIQAWAPMEVVEALLARAEKAETAIQRVRDAVTERQREVSDMDPAFRMTVLIDVAAVLRALDGDGDE